VVCNYGRDFQIDTKEWEEPHLCVDKALKTCYALSNFKDSIFNECRRLGFTEEDTSLVRGFLDRSTEKTVLFPKSFDKTGDFKLAKNFVKPTDPEATPIETAIEYDFYKGDSAFLNGSTDLCDLLAPFIMTDRHGKDTTELATKMANTLAIVVRQRFDNDPSELTIGKNKPTEDGKPCEYDFPFEPHTYNDNRMSTVFLDNSFYRLSCKSKMFSGNNTLMDDRIYKGVWSRIPESVNYSHYTTHVKVGFRITELDWDTTVFGQDKEAYTNKKKAFNELCIHRGLKSSEGKKVLFYKTDIRLTLSCVIHHNTDESKDIFLDQVMSFVIDTGEDNQINSFRESDNLRIMCQISSRSLPIALDGDEEEIINNIVDPKTNGMAVTPDYLFHKSNLFKASHFKNNEDLLFNCYLVTDDDNMRRSSIFRNILERAMAKFYVGSAEYHIWNMKSCFRDLLEKYELVVHTYLIMCQFKELTPRNQNFYKARKIRNTIVYNDRAIADKLNVATGRTKRSVANLDNLSFDTNYEIIARYLGLDALVIKTEGKIFDDRNFISSEILADTLRGMYVLSMIRNGLNDKYVDIFKKLAIKATKFIDGLNPNVKEYYKYPVKKRDRRIKEPTDFNLTSYPETKAATEEDGEDGYEMIPINSSESKELEEAFRFREEFTQTFFEDTSRVFSDESIANFMAQLAAQTPIKLPNNLNMEFREVVITQPEECKISGIDFDQLNYHDVNGISEAVPFPPTLPWSEVTKTELNETKKPPFVLSSFYNAEFTDKATGTILNPKAIERELNRLIAKEDRSNDKLNLSKIDTSFLDKKDTNNIIVDD